MRGKQGNKVLNITITNTQTLHLFLLHMYTWGCLDPTIWGTKQGRSQNFGSSGEQQKQVSYMNSSHVLYCNSIAKISVLGKHSGKMYLSKTF